MEQAIRRRKTAVGIKAIRQIRKLYPERERGFHAEEQFHRVLTLERKRSERSLKPVRLMLVDMENISAGTNKRHLAAVVARAISAAMRETDIKGWYRQDVLLGVVFTETNGMDEDILRRKVMERLDAVVPEKERLRIIVSFHLFPASGSNGRRAADPEDLTWYPDLPDQERSRRIARMTKRAIDIVGSMVGIILFSPLFILISCLIKLTSAGPVLFKQERIGQYGKPFMFLKFRTMHTNNDPDVHRDFVRNLIAGESEPDGEGKKIYKITDDKRVTSIGHILRKSSMDELPQFFNVLRGEMSLVGPRPPIPYEVEMYDVWHWRRLIEIKPGITGLWQVSGRSSTTFDEMVRLDLQYAREWSLWMDIKILLKTPGAVIWGKGAY